MKLPTLYKKSAGGAIQFWNIEVIRQHASCGDASIIETTYGQLGTDSPQKAQEIIDQGKNTGKANATTPHEQAIKEAQAKWKLQKAKKGYVETKEAAEAGEVDAVVEGGIFPMLADKFAKRADKVTYPAYAQPKLDGHRCIAIVEDGVCTLWSRTRKPINSVPHICRAVERLTGGADAILDGELYNHDYKKDFEKITSLIRQKEPAEGHEKVQFHIYDMPSEQEQYYNRHIAISKLFKLAIDTVDYPGSIECLVEVETKQIQDEDEAMLAFDEFLKKGYEGAMVRTRGGVYLGHPTKRSADLLKIKEFDDAEFKVVGVKEGTGKMAGKAIFVCEYGKETFDAKMKGPLEKLKVYWDNPRPYIGKQLTVQYQGFTKKKNVPRFGVALRFREDA